MRIVIGGKERYKITPERVKALIDWPTASSFSRLLSSLGKLAEAIQQGDKEKFADLLTGIKMKDYDAIEQLLRTYGSKASQINELLRKNTWRYKTKEAS